MDNHYGIGRDLILEAAWDQLERMASVEGFLPFATPYGGSDIFQVALRRIGENDFADKFVDPNPTREINISLGLDARASIDECNETLECRVLRVASSDVILAGIVAAVERGDFGFAQRLEHAQRDLFCVDDVGYLDPHFYGSMEVNTKDRIRANIQRYGLPLGQFEVTIRNNGKKEKGELIGAVSLSENIYASLGNLAIGDEEHARRVLDQVYTLYFDPDLGLFREDYCVGKQPMFKNFDRTMNMMRAMDLAGDERGRELFENNNGILIEGFRKSAEGRSGIYPFQAIPLIFGFDHFGKVGEAADLREYLVGEIPSIKENTRFGDVNFLYTVKSQLCQVGLALTGLERGKPNQFYTW